LDAYENTLVERALAAELRRQSEVAGLTDPQRGELFARARQLESTPLSRAVHKRTRGRPKRSLSQAMSQHLARAGFSQSQIARLMADNAGSTRKRIGVGEQRSLAMFAPSTLDQSHLTHRKEHARGSATPPAQRLARSS
jgi:hypothetical protein